MMEFSEYQQPAKTIALHYASRAENSLASMVYGGQMDVRNAEEAKTLTEFFWSMSDDAAEDHAEDREISNQYDLEFWMEKLMNITIGYLTSLGYGDVWKDESFRINS
ncbi:hypothetical protein BTA51_27620 [Hahella sp. CCB-MM4]|uniref:hypothetical protein n=1 Tax=Hahella sp. (strain CCB-MM4) TaxID=1926491 RepID=UPI000B9A1D01|nr:hypothetical protein [Hahella sp. CCB-MM4]OZG70141.1 hypothetical protein BTA51_27620 [Hahella sp. CCB-MM4]